MKTVNHHNPATSGVEHIDIVEWLDKKAQEAKRRGDYEGFEYWRRAYLNAQAALRRERELEKQRFAVSVDRPTNQEGRI